MKKREIISRTTYLQKHHPDLFVALRHHRTHKGNRITFEGYQYLVDIYLDQSEKINVKKATQGGLSEYLQIKAFMKAISGRSIFYVLPTDRIVSRVVKNRIDRAMQFTPYYQSKERERKGRFSDSVSLKHLGSGAIAFVPSNSTSAFTEFPADDVIIDELDECDQSNLNMAVERLSASEDPRIIQVGNPTILNFGIDYEFTKSDQKEWHIRCGSCGEWIVPDFFVHVVKEVEQQQFVILDKRWERGMDRDINLICHKCHKPFDRAGQGKWVARNSSPISGYHISKLFSTNMTIKEILDRFTEGLRSDSKLQRFYNGDLGLAYTSSGAKLNYDLLNECREEYNMPSSSQNVCIGGFDVGNVIHGLIAELMPDKRARIVFAGTVEDEADIRDLWLRYNVRAGCIDALPERRLSRKLSQSLKGMFVVYYGDLKSEKIDINNKIVLVDRTSSLDGVREAFLTKQIILPQNADLIAPLCADGHSELYYELCNSTRIFDEDKKKYSWVEGSTPDHYFHAANYLMIARRILMKVM